MIGRTSHLGTLAVCLAGDHPCLPTYPFSLMQVTGRFTATPKAPFGVDLSWHVPSTDHTVDTRLDNFPIVWWDKHQEAKAHHTITYSDGGANTILCSRIFRVSEDGISITTHASPHWSRRSGGVEWPMSGRVIAETRSMSQQSQTVIHQLPICLLGKGPKDAGLGMKRG